MSSSDYEIAATYDGSPQLPNGVALTDVFTGPDGTNAGISSSSADPSTWTWYDLSSNTAWTMNVVKADADGSYLVPVDFHIRNKATDEIVSVTQNKFVLQMIVADGFVYSTIPGQQVGFVVDSYTSPSGTVTGYIRFTSSGQILGDVTSSDANVSSVQEFTSSWSSGSVDTSTLEIRATVGTTSAADATLFYGPTDWVSLNQNREWGLTLPVSATDGAYDRPITFEIRDTAQSNAVVTTTSGNFTFDCFVADQDALVSNTLTGDSVALEIDEFGTGGSATISISFNTDGTISGTTSTSGSVTTGGVNETFSGTWANFGAPAPTTPAPAPAPEPSDPPLPPDDSGNFNLV